MSQAPEGFDLDLTATQMPPALRAPSPPPQLPSGNQEGRVVVPGELGGGRDPQVLEGHKGKSQFSDSTALGVLGWGEWGYDRDKE